MWKFYKLLFIYTLTLSTLITISSYSWFSTWIGLEMNLLSFIPLIKANNMYSSECVMKYFITQALASSLLLFSVLIMLNNPNFNLFNTSMSVMMLNSSLFLKMGAAPFHFWFPEVIEGMNWSNALILLTWQKIAPMILLMYNLKSIMMMNIIIIYSALISGIQGFNQLSLRKIMAYSSINHISWMLASMLNSLLIWSTYFIIYSLININIIFMFKMTNIFTIQQLSLSPKNKILKMIFMMNFLDLGGLPPFIGFLPKWLTINNLIENNLYMMSIFLILFTLITLYYYVRLMHSTLMLNSSQSMNFHKNWLSPNMMGLNMIVLTSLICCTMLFNYY